MTPEEYERWCEEQIAESKRHPMTPEEKAAREEWLDRVLEKFAWDEAHDVPPEEYEPEGPPEEELLDAVLVYLEALCLTDRPRYLAWALDRLRSTAAYAEAESDQGFR